MFHQLLYVSGAKGPISSEDIAAILTSSRRNNAKVGVTGLLLATDGVFIQFLEGARADVEALVDRIRRDPRHRNVMVMMERESAERVFSAWHMGFKTLNRAIASEERAFEVSRAALQARVGGGDAEMVLDTIIAFAGDKSLKAA